MHATCIRAYERCTYTPVLENWGGEAYSEAWNSSLWLLAPRHGLSCISLCYQIRVRLILDNYKRTCLIDHYITGSDNWVHAALQLCMCMLLCVLDCIGAQPYVAIQIILLQAYSKCGNPKEAELLLQDTVVSDCYSVLHERHALVVLAEMAQWM